MKKAAILCFLLLGGVLSTQLWAQDNEGSSLSDRIYWGGGFGLSFGDITYVSVSPMAGYKIKENWGAGLGLIYRYRKDERYEPELSTSDYGFDLFTQYIVKQPFFLQAQYEYLSYEYYFTADLNQLKKDRGNFNGLYVGGGIFEPIGSGRSAFFASAMYNLNYDDSGPYGTPWLISVGFSTGFGGY